MNSPTHPKHNSRDIVIIGGVQWHDAISHPTLHAIRELMREHRRSEAFRNGLHRASRLLALRCAAAVARQADELAALLARGR